MQNYIEIKTRKSIFHIEKQIKNHVNPFSIFAFTKRTKNRIRHNLLSETEQVSLDVRVFDLFCLQILII